MTNRTIKYEFDLGPWTRPVTTRSSEAQIWFDRGLNWTYGFNQEEAVICFQRALEQDPDCAMAWWGIAYAAGPFYNRPWIRFTDAEVKDTLVVCHHAAREAQRALERAHSSDPVEVALIDAIQKRYQSATENDRPTLDAWHRDYADAMRTVYRDRPDDPDVVALFAEAAITCTPRQLWELGSGTPKVGSLTEEVLSALEPILDRLDASDIVHPGLLHIYIHVLEMAPFPERALNAADALRDYAPDAGHLEHMPAHIYVLCGDYAQSVEQSHRAIKADDRYLAYAGARNFYTTARCHDFHLLMYAAMMIGQYRTALYAAERIGTIVTPDLLEASFPFMASILDGYSAMRTHVLVRFGKWRDLIAEPACEDPEHTPIRHAMQLYGKGIGHAALGQVNAAQTVRETFREAVSAIPDDAVFLSNKVRDVLGVGEAMLDGELMYRQQTYDQAFESLRRAVARDDALNYTEPWAWMHPPRHALGALLAEQGRYDEAETVYRQDLGYDPSLARCCQNPDNVWALHGLLECVERRGAAPEAAMLAQKLTIAKARADVPIEASCCCRRSQALA